MLTAKDLWVSTSVRVAPDTTIAIELFRTGTNRYATRMVTVRLGASGSLVLLNPQCLHHVEELVLPDICISRHPVPVSVARARHTITIECGNQPDPLHHLTHSIFTAGSLSAGYCIRAPMLSLGAQAKPALHRKTQGGRRPGGGTTAPI